MFSRIDRTCGALFTMKDRIVKKNSRGEGEYSILVMTVCTLASLPDPMWELGKEATGSCTPALRVTRAGKPCTQAIETDKLLVCVA